MGKSLTAKYRIEASYVHFKNQRREIARMGWLCKDYGSPSAANIEKFFAGFAASLLPGQPNAHLHGTVSPYGSGRIIHQKSGKVVAEYSEPTFKII